MKKNESLPLPSELEARLLHRRALASLHDSCRMLYDLTPLVSDFERRRVITEICGRLEVEERRLKEACPS
jgi:hypothetical protein